MEQQQTFGSGTRAHIKQRDSWLSSLKVKLTPSVETILKELYGAAILCNQRDRGLTIKKAFGMLLEKSKAWDESLIQQELGYDKFLDAEVCLHEAIKEHGKVLSLSTANTCCETINVPTLSKFFLDVLHTSASDLDDDITIFQATDISIKKELRKWINQIIQQKVLDIVPITRFVNKSPPVVVEQVQPAPVVQQDVPTQTVLEEAVSTKTPPEEKEPVKEETIEEEVDEGEEEEVIEEEEEEVEEEK
jgi:hypothetical protein